MRVIKEYDERKKEILDTAAMISMLEKILNVPEDYFMKLFIENFGKM